MDHDLLLAPLLSWRDAQRRRGKTTLPGLLARLASGELADFPRLRAHQLHPWCMFLTQLAAIALHQAGKSDPGLSEEDWCQLLLTLTAGGHEPWSLVVEDLAQPAFFQPPVPEGTTQGWSTHRSPDDIDLLVTAKNHDVKAGLFGSDDVEAWVFAIVTLQTMQGVYGQGKYGIARMKKGYGSRPRVGVAADATLTSRFLRDVQTLLASWPGLVERGYRDDGLALVWTEPWAGSTSLAMHELAPHFIEVCRRVRCSLDNGSVSCADTTSKTRRCLAEVENGDVGDPWIPIERSEGALNVSARGFDYQVLTGLLFSNDFEPAAAQALQDADGDPVLFLASALARGQGKTNGLHERMLTLSGAARRKLGQPDGRAALGKRASGRVDAADKMRSKVLFPALQQIALGEHVVPDRFTARVDDLFFDDLFGTLAASDDEARLAFDARIRDIAWSELQRAIDRCCVPDAQSLKAISAAERMFKGCLNKNFPDLVAVEAKSQGVPS